jgi:Zn finger protein HypA/HybF involved in hydrogenase expression
MQYDDSYVRKYGYLRPVIPEVVQGYLKCGDLTEGFARVRCPDCHHEYLLAFSCRGRWFCPSCHSKKVVQFGIQLKENILYSVPHRQYVFSIPIILRTYFKYDRKSLGKFCHCVNQSLLQFFRKATGLKKGKLAAVMVIQTFGDYARWHPHVHVLLADGLFREKGVFYVMPKIDIQPLAELFRANVLKMLKKEGRIDEGLIEKLLKWRHNSGFSVHNGVRLARDDDAGRETLAQYIMRNPFSVKKIRYNAATGTVIYKSQKTQRKSKGGRKNFQVFKATHFIAAITQHIPEKSFQLVRYYGWYSNRGRGEREKRNQAATVSLPDAPAKVEIIDVSEYRPKKIPSPKWRECIKKVWEVDPLSCPKCGSEMKIISFINEADVIRKILEHLGLWEEKTAFERAPPDLIREKSSELFDDGWPQYEEPFVTVH